MVTMHDISGHEFRAVVGSVAMRLHRGGDPAEIKAELHRRFGSETGYLLFAAGRTLLRLEVES